MTDEQQWRNRIIESGDRPLADVKPNPQNWRRHPKRQRDALQAVLDQVGVVDTIVVNQRTGLIVDGHLRDELASQDGAERLPMDLVDLSPEEEAAALAVLDPIGALAAIDTAVRDDLLGEQVRTSDRAALKALVAVHPKLPTPDAGLMRDIARGELRTGIDRLEQGEVGSEPELAGAVAGGGGGEDSAGPITLRQMAIQYDQETYDVIESGLRELATWYGTANVTDTLVQAVLDARIAITEPD